MATQQFNPTPEERQAWANMLRATLHEKGAYPTERGERAALTAGAGIRQDLAELLQGLGTSDLFCLEVLAHYFKDTEASGWRDRERARAQELRQRDPANEPPGRRWEAFTYALGYARFALGTWGRSVYRHKLAAR